MDAVCGQSRIGVEQFFDGRPLTKLAQYQLDRNVWECSVDEALMAPLARAADRAWEAIKEAALIEELGSIRR
jgi:hypothetical protein